MLVFFKIKKKNFARNRFFSFKKGKVSFYNKYANYQFLFIGLNKL